MHCFRLMVAQSTLFWSFNGSILTAISKKESQPLPLKARHKLWAVIAHRLPQNNNVSASHLQGSADLIHREKVIANLNRKADEGERRLQG